jgi:hypothetical protein
VSILGGDGFGATAVASIGGPITGIILTNPGSGYSSTPAITIVGGGGTGATATAALSTAAAIAMSAAGNARIRSVNGPIDVYDAPLAGSGGRTVRVATVSGLAGTYAAGTPGSLASTIRGAAGQSINDQLAVFGTSTRLRVNDRVLIKNDVGGDARANGVYVVTLVGGSGTGGWLLTRAADSDTSAECPTNSIVAVTEGRKFYRLSYEGTLGLVAVAAGEFVPSTNIGVDTPDDSRKVRFVVGSTSGTNRGAGSLGKMIELRQQNDTRFSSNPQQTMEFAFSSLITAPIVLTEQLPAITGNRFVASQSKIDINGSARVTPAGSSATNNSQIAVSGRFVTRNRESVPVFRGTVTSTVQSAASPARTKIVLPATYSELSELAVGMAVSGIGVRPGTRITGIDLSSRVISLSAAVDAPEGSQLSTTFALAVNGFSFEGTNAAGSSLRNLRVGGFETDAAVRVSAPTVTVDRLILGQDSSGERLPNEYGVAVGSGGNGALIISNLITSSTVAGVVTQGNVRDVVIAGNTIGTALLPNVSGVEVAGTGMVYVGDASRPRNLIQHNQRGVVIRSGASQVINNTIAQSVFEGVRVDGNAVNYAIGTSTERSGVSNAIYGNRGYGIFVTAGAAPANPQLIGRRIQGNYLGLVASGDAVQANSLANVFVGGADPAINYADILGFLPDSLTQIDSHGNQHGLGTDGDGGDGGGGGGGGDGVDRPRPTPIVKDPRTAADTVILPTAGTYAAGSVLSFAVTFNSPVYVTGQPVLPLQVGTAIRSAQYVGGTGTRRLTFRYVVAAGDAAPQGIRVGASVAVPSGAAIRGGDGTASLLSLRSPSAAAIRVDAVGPAITRVILPESRTYRAGNELRFRLVFNEVVSVTGIPTLPLVIGGQVKQAELVAGTGTNTLTFAFRIGAGDKAPLGVSLGRALRLVNAAIRDAAGNLGQGVVPTVNASGIIVA